MYPFVAHTEEAARVLAAVTQQTPLTPSTALGARVNAQVLLKQENLQLTNTCKARSAYFMLSRLSPDQQRQVVTVSTGNNGISMAWAMERLGIDGTVFLANNVQPHKIAAIRRYPVEILFSGDDIVDAEIAARAFATEHAMTFRSPYNEWEAMYAQATIAQEILQQLPNPEEPLDAVIVPVGGGGLIGGIAAYLRAVRPETRIIGVQPSHSAVMAQSVAAGQILEMPSAPTLSDATAGGVEQGAITFAFCRDYVSEYILVDEDEIAAAMVLLHDAHGITVEGAGALAVAALLQGADRFVDQRVALLLCGANVAPSLLDKLKAA